MRSAAKTPQPRGNSYAWGVCVFLLLAVAVIYGQTLDHDLLGYDDSLFVFANPHVTAGLTGDRFAGLSPRGRPASGIRWTPCRTCSIASSLDCTPGDTI